MNSRLPNQITVERRIGEERVAIWKEWEIDEKTSRTPTWRANCRCFPHGGSHQRVNLYACFPFLYGDAKRHKDLSWFGQEKALHPAREGVCIILHLSACTGVNTSMVWSMEVLLHMSAVLPG